MKNGHLQLDSTPSDAEFGKELSQAFVELGFLPEGFELYCGVEFGEDRSKRSADGMSSPAKRSRSKLFTLVESY